MAQTSKTPRAVLGRDDFMDFLRTEATHLTPDFRAAEVPDIQQQVNDLKPGIDQGWSAENVPQIVAMRELVNDASSVSRGAEVLVSIMSEFAVDGENFQPSIDQELRQWLLETLRREVPEIDDATAEMLVGAVQDFPPTDEAHSQELARQIAAPVESNVT